MHEILRDERGRGLFYGKEPNDELSKRLQRPMTIGEIESIHHKHTPTSGDVELDLQNLADEFVKLQLTESPENVAFTNGPEQTKKLELSEVQLGDWLAPVPEDDPGRPERIGKMIAEIKGKDGDFAQLTEALEQISSDARERSSAPRRRLRELMHSLTEKVVQADQLPVRRRDEIREMLKLVSSCAHLHARLANLEESLLHAKRRWILETSGVDRRGAESPETRRKLRIENLETAVNQRWAHVCRLCVCGNELSQYLLPAQSDVQIRETIAIRSLHASSLAHLRRFTEAHRRLDEASAFLFNSRYAVHEEHWGTLALRRSEIHLHEALDGMLQFRGVTGTFRRQLSKLDDAWSAAERAEWWLGGNNRSNWWWGRLHVVKLRILACVEEIKSYAEDRPNGDPNDLPGRFLPLTERTRTDLYKQVVEILEQVCLMVPQDGLRLTRTLDCVRVICECKMRQSAENAKSSGKSEAPEETQWTRLWKRCFRLLDKLVSGETTEGGARGKELNRYMEFIWTEFRRLTPDDKQLLDETASGASETIESVSAEHEKSRSKPTAAELAIPVTERTPVIEKHQSAYVFISYFSEDVDHVRRLVHDLKKEGIAVWQDENDLEKSKELDVELHHAIRQARTFLLINSKAWKQREEEWKGSVVYKEIAWAEDKHARFGANQPFIMLARIEESQIIPYLLTNGKHLDRGVPRHELKNPKTWASDVKNLVKSLRSRGH